MAGFTSLLAIINKSPSIIFHMLIKQFEHLLASAGSETLIIHGLNTFLCTCFGLPISELLLVDIFINYSCSGFIVAWRVKDFTLTMKLCNLVIHFDEV